MIHLDTSVLIDALTGPRRSAPVMRRAIAQGERIGCSTIVLYEWLRGSRLPEEIAAQAVLVPLDQAVVFGVDEAARAADLYRTLRKPRGREIDLAIAACALAHDAGLWTLNESDFKDIPGLKLYHGRAKSP